MFTDQQIEAMLQAVRGLPAGSQELANALAAVEKNDRWAAAFMLGDVTEHAQKITKRTRLSDDLYYAVRKSKLKAYLAEHPLHDLDLNDDGAVNNLLQLLYEPEYFDSFMRKEEPATPQLRQVYEYEEKPPLSPEEELHEIIDAFKQLAGDSQDWSTDILKKHDKFERKAEQDPEREM